MPRLGVIGLPRERSAISTIHTGSSQMEIVPGQTWLDGCRGRFQSGESSHFSMVNVVAGLCSWI